MTDFQSIGPSYRDSVLLRSSVPINGIRTLAPMRKRERSAFGARLKAAREKARLTQPQLAQAVGMSQSTLAEAEGVGHSSSFTVRIAEFCGVSALWLESGEGNMLDSSTWPFTLELLGAVNSLSSDGRCQLENLIRVHLGMALVTAPIPEQSTQQAVSTSSDRQNSSPAVQKTSPLLDNARVGGSSSASRKDGGIQKPRSGRGPKRAA